MPLNEVPIIDLAPYYHGGEAGKQQVAEAVGKACREIGFLTISGHGIADALVERCYSTARDFFAQPLELKARCDRPAPDQVRGYSAVGGEGLSYSLGEPAPPDLKESLTIGPINVDRGDPYFTGAAAGPHFAPNLWPESPADLKSAWTEYFAAMETLAADLMRIFAIALKLPENFFDDKIDRHISMFRALKYPSQKEAPLPGQLRAGAHSDYGSLTILRQENRPGGLEVRDKQGAWVPIAAVPGTFVVNIGDLMMQWTNDTWISTMHRVANPPSHQAGDSDRISLVFFHQPNYDAMVECLESCRTAGQPAKYPAVSSGDHLRSKFVRQTTLGKEAEDLAA